MRIVINSIYWTALISFVFLWDSANTRAASRDEEGISEAEFFGAKVAGEEVGIWFKELAKRPVSTAIFNVRVRNPLPDSYGNVLETEILNALRTIEDIRVSSCPDCRSPRVEVVNDRLVISKGSPDINALKELGRKTQVESFLVIEAYRTAMSVVIMANLYQSGSGDVIDSRTFRVPVLNIAGAASQILLTFGPGMSIDGPTHDDKDSSIPVAASLSILEELGFGKGGLVLGAAIDKSAMLAYANPTLAWRGRFSSAALYSLRGIGLGLGASKGAFGITPRIFYDFFIGSMVSIGFEAIYMIPIKDKKESNDRLSGYAGVHIGFSLGR